MMTMRLQVILEHIPVTQDQIQNYIVHTQVTEQLHALFLTLTLHFISVSLAPSQNMDGHMLAVGGNQTCKPDLHDVAAQA